MKEINIKLIKKFIAHKMKIKFKYKKTQIYKNRYISKNKKNYTNKFYSKIQVPMKFKLKLMLHLKEKIASLVRKKTVQFKK